ncbi:MAG: hypothetical protein J7L47_09170 [Candidatus Odinarchaeota archaeon]|nr:hypothetical protein [Candidatus Odinarchaeota archaeon]
MAWSGVSQQVITDMLARHTDKLRRAISELVEWRAQGISVIYSNDHFQIFIKLRFYKRSLVDDVLELCKKMYPALDWKVSIFGQQIAKISAKVYLNKLEVL